MTGKSSILIVEDDPIISQLIQWRLEKLGYHVSGRAPTAEEALEKMRKDLPDLVLIDINLPGSMDGTDLARRVREEFHVPFVYLTAFSDDETISRVLDTRPAGYLLKPFKDEELKVTIEIALRQPKGT
ncbi:MAG: response regulator [Methanolinea sp.]|nr:response regulator [Methanolinea sp.]